MSLTVIANVYAKFGKVDVVKEELEKLADATRCVEGCISYDMHQDHNNPAHFIFYENWKDKESWKNNSKAFHTNAYHKATEGAIEDFVVNEMSQLPPRKRRRV